jgi:hypothetical protein
MSCRMRLKLRENTFYIIERENTFYNIDLFVVGLLDVA